MVWKVAFGCDEYDLEWLLWGRVRTKGHVCVCVVGAEQGFVGLEVGIA